MLITENIDNKRINSIKQTGAGSWTEDMIKTAVAYLITINPSLVLLQIVNNAGRLECVVSGEFNNCQTVFQAPMPRLTDCVVNDQSLVNIVRDETERATRNDEMRILQQTRALELKLLEAEQKVLDVKAKASAKIDKACEEVDVVVTRLIKVMADISDNVNAPDYGLKYHLGRLVSYSVGANACSIRGNTQNMIATAEGPFLNIARECCFLPQSLDLNFKPAGWKCSSKIMAARVADQWNNHLPALQVALDKYNKI